MINNIPVYRMIVDLDDESTGMVAISFVEDPAVEVDFLAFDKQKQPMKFSITDESEHKVTGVAIYADKYIYRWNQSIGDYYVYFDRQTIENIVEKYSKENLLNSVDLQHDGENVEGVTMIEYFIKDSAKGINPKGFEDVSDGSLFVTYKVRNDEVWEQIRNNEVKGFSIEIYTDAEFVSMTDEDEDMDFDAWVESFLDEKKKFDKVKYDDVAKAIKSKKQVVIDGKTGQILAVGTEGKNKQNIIFMDLNGKWRKIYIDDIKTLEQTNSPLIDWNFEDPTYKTLIDDEENIITETNVAEATTLQDAIANNMTCIINYNDEQENPATGARQCWVTSYGTTIAGNGCVRIWEMYGASRSGLSEGDGWRLLLVRRITSFRIMKDVEPFTTAPNELYNGEAQSGSGKNGTMDTVIIKSNLV